MAGSREDSPSRLVSDYLFFLFFSFFFSFWEMMAGFGAHSDFFFFFLSSFFFSLSRDPLVRSAHGKDHLAELLGADRYRRYPLSGPDRLRGGRGQDGGLPLSNSFPFYFIFFNSQPVFDLSSRRTKQPPSTHNWDSAALFSLYTILHKTILNIRVPSPPVNNSSGPGVPAR